MRLSSSSLFIGSAIAIVAVCSIDAEPPTTSNDAYSPETRPAMLSRDEEQFENLCEYVSSAPPDPLSGRLEQEQYTFIHTSDVDVLGASRRFASSIRNLRDDAYLPAEWLRSDGSVELAFTRIAPGGCGGSEFQTYQSENEDGRAVINFGPTKSLKKSAPLYVVGGAGNDGRAGAGPLLMFRIHAEIQDDEPGDDKVLHLRFTSMFEGRQAVYSVENLGMDDELFTIPELTDAWNRANPDAVFQWETRGDRFVIQQDGASRQTLRLTEGGRLQERPVTLIVWSDANVEIAKASVAIYLPVTGD